MSSAQRPHTVSSCRTQSLVVAHSLWQPPGTHSLPEEGAFFSAPLPLLPLLLLACSLARSLARRPHIFRWRKSADKWQLAAHIECCRIVVAPRLFSLLGALFSLLGALFSFFASSSLPWRPSWRVSRQLVHCCAARFAQTGRPLARFRRQATLLLAGEVCSRWHSLGLLRTARSLLPQQHFSPSTKGSLEQDSCGAASQHRSIAGEEKSGR